MDPFSVPSHVRADTRRNIYEESYTGRLSSIQSRFGASSDSGLVIPCKPSRWYGIHRTIREVWTALKPHGWQLPSVSTIVWTTSLALVTIVLVIEFFQSDLWQRQVQRAYKFLSCCQAAWGRILGDIGLVYYRIRFSSAMAEISRKRYVLGTFFRVHPLQWMLLALALMTVSAVWRLERGKATGEDGVEYFVVPYYMERPRNEQGSNYLGDWNYRRVDGRSGRIDSGLRSSGGEKTVTTTITVSQTETSTIIARPETTAKVETYTSTIPCLASIKFVVDEASSTCTTKGCSAVGLTSTVTKTEQRTTTTQVCDPITSTISGIQISINARTIDHSTYYETRTVTMTERDTRTWPPGEGNAASSPSTVDPAPMVSEDGTIQDQKTEECEFRDDVGDGLHWCSSCKQKHCCEVPY